MKCYTLTESPDALRVIFAPRCGPGYGPLRAIMMAAPLVASSAAVLSLFILPSVLPAKVAHSPIVGYVMMSLFGLAFLTGGLNIAMRSRLARYELLIRNGRIRASEYFGTLTTWRNGCVASITRLQIDHAKLPRDDQKMKLTAHNADGPPLLLATGYPENALKQLAKELATALPNWGGGRVTVGDTDQPLSARAMPPPKTKIVLERPQRGEVRFLVPGVSLKVALSVIIGLNVVLFAIFNSPYGTRTGGFHGTFSPRIENALNAFGPILVFLLPETIALLVIIANHTVEAGPNGLTITSRNPLYTKVKTWSPEQLRDIEVLIAHGGEGGQMRELRIIPQKGRKSHYLRGHKVAELNWIRAELLAALRPPMKFAAKKLTNDAESINKQTGWQI